MTFLILTYIFDMAAKKRNFYGVKKGSDFLNVSVISFLKIGNIEHTTLPWERTAS